MAWVFAFYLLWQMPQDSVATSSPGLEGIMEPPPIPFTFEAIGWKITLGILMLLLMLVAYRVYKKYQKNQYRRDAIANIKKLLETTTPGRGLVTQVLFNLKQTALKTYGRSETASLTGEKWLAFLDQKVKGSHFVRYRELVEEVTYHGQFKPQHGFDAKEFAEMSIKWIERHA